MGRSSPHRLLLVVAALGLGATGPGHSQGVSTRNLAPAARSVPSGRPFPVSFHDVARQAGLQMKFSSGNEETKKFIVEANGSGVAFLDYDNDGWQDLFLVNGSRLEGFPAGQAPTNRLYRNNKNGQFTDVTRQAQLARSGWGNGVCAGDFDNDGNQDLYVTYWGPNVLYRNEGSGKFQDVTSQSGVAGPAQEWSSGCTFLDYDRDGLLDLFVTRYQVLDLARAPLPGKASNCEWKGLPVFCGPRGLPFGSAALYRNHGDGRFSEVTKQAGIADVQGYYAFTAVAADLNQDGWTDIYVACDSTPSIFFRNNKDGTFSDIATETGIAFSEHGFEQGGMGVSVGDYDNDGRLDLLKTNFAGDYPNLYRNTGGGIFEDLVVKAGLAVNPQYVGWGVGFVDLDNDGRKDIFQVNGHVYPELDRRMGEETYRNPRLVYRNLGNGSFEDVTAMAGPGVAQKMSSRGAAFADYDNDGDIDVLIMNMGEAPSLLRNELKNDTQWIKVLLEGTKSNRSAIGATVAIQAGGVAQTDAVLSQSSFISQNDRRLHFGLGPASRVDRFQVRWPSGVGEEFPGSAADRLVVLVEGSGVPKPVTLGK